MQQAYLFILLASFFSFWYSSLKIFKRSTTKKNKHWYFLRVLTLAIWYGSFIEILYFQHWRQAEIFAWISILMCLLGLVIFWWSAYSIRSENFMVIFNNEKPQQRHESGPYKYVRHPFYTSYITCYLSLLLVTDSIFLAVAVAALAGYYFWAALKEEQNFLNSDLKENYLAYRKKTGMFFPKFL